MRFLSLVLVVVAFVPAMAHALEMPGKMRLDKEEYGVVQRIYYPGFTVAGAAEPIALICLALMLVFRPPGTNWPLLVTALGSMVLMHAIYWIVTHPINNFWLKDVPLKAGAARFFSFGSKNGGTGTAEADWIRLRDRWEWSHVARAALAGCGLTALVASLI